MSTHVLLLLSLDILSMLLNACPSVTSMYTFYEIERASHANGDDIKEPSIWPRKLYLYQYSDTAWETFDFQNSSTSLDSCLSSYKQLVRPIVTVKSNTAAFLKRLDDDNCSF